MPKVEDVTITDEGRDKGKVFRITEMPAVQAERWAFRVFQALAKAGVDMPANMFSAGMAGIAVLSLKALALLPSQEAFELMDEMMGCVSVIRDPGGAPNVVTRLLDTDIEEVWTRVMLRDKILELHTGFSVAAAMSRLNSMAAKTSTDSSNTQTSPDSSAPSSPTS